MLFHPNDFENSPEALDIYADIEDMTGVAQAAPELYAHYLLTLQERAFDSLLDIGCGNGEFLASIAGAFPESRLNHPNMKVSINVFSKLWRTGS